MFVGFGKRDITPAPDVYLAGNGEYKSHGIHDPLFARALVFADGNEWVAVVSADLIGVEFETVLQVRRILRDAGCGNAENVLISCTHTHNGPHTRFSKSGFLLHRDEEYLARLAERFAEAIMEADANKEKVSFKYGRGYACENFNRRLTLPDGSTYLYAPRPLRENPDIAGYAHGVADREVDALQFLREDGSVKATVAHYAAHPLTVGVFEDMVSADYPGALVRGIEQNQGSDAMFVQGACGDLHSKGLFEGFDRMEEMGRNLCAAVGDILEKCGPPVENPRLAFAKKDVFLPTVLSSDRDDPATRDRMKLWNMDLFDKRYRGEMSAVSFGPIAFVSAPGELLCEPGLQIKWHSAFEQTWILYNCNSYSSYIAHPRAYAEGGYEGATGQCLDKKACQIVLDTAADLLRKVAS